MAFPPAFDRAWDETQPPDTQAANLLGQDIRQLKTDIRERLSLLSGTLANRPSNMDAIYGGAGFGILYFSTDTGQIFQWNGATWNSIGIGAQKYSDTTSYFTAGVPLTTAGFIIPANTLSVGSFISVKGYGIAGGGSGTGGAYNIQIAGGGSTFSVSLGNPFEEDFTVLVTSAAAGQVTAKLSQDTNNVIVGSFGVVLNLATNITVNTVLTPGSGYLLNQKGLVGVVYP